MSFIQSMKTLDHKFSWSFTGVLLAMVFGSISIYQEFFKVNNPNLSYVITSNSSVLDIKENVKELEIRYANNDILTLGKDIRLITLKVINNGNFPILPSYYDPEAPVGFEIINGEFAEKPSITSTSNEYLNGKIHVIPKSPNLASFTNAIIDEGEYFTLRILVLHDKEKIPQIRSVGKVAGIKEIYVVSGETPKEEQGALSIIFSGGWLVNSIRTIVFGVLFITSMGLAVAAGATIDEEKKKRKRKKLVESFKDVSVDATSEEADYIFRAYIKDGALKVKEIRSTIRDTSEIKLYLGLKNIAKSGKDYTHKVDANDIIADLLDREIIIDNNGEIEINQRFANIVRHFYSLLKRKGELRIYSADIGIGKISEDEKEYLKLKSELTGAKEFSYLTKNDFEAI